MNIYNCYFDGSCTPKNPDGDMGYGVYIKSDDSEFFDAKHIPAKIGNNNNIAEYLGLIHILNLMLRKKNTHIKIFGDSLLVINQMNGSFAINRGGYVPYAEKAMGLVQKIKENNIIEFNWIPRVNNKIADDLSKSYIEGKYPIIKKVSGINTPDKQSINSNRVFIHVELPQALFSNKNIPPSKTDIVNILNGLNSTDISYFVKESVNKGVDSIDIIEDVVEQNKTKVEPINDKPTETKVLNESDVLWNNFKIILEKSIKNRDDFAEIYTETKFNDMQLEHINSIDMISHYYDDSVGKYVITLKW